MLTGSFHELPDVHFDHVAGFLLLGLLFVDALHSMGCHAARLLRERGVDVTGLDVL
ncbi:MAG TPA: hypothetical protein PLU47_13230 [Azonexus sp.]|nr:hypothetical protein [Azonexus sp.]